MKEKEISKEMMKKIVINAYSVDNIELLTELQLKEIVENLKTI